MDELTQDLVAKVIPPDSLVTDVDMKRFGSSAVQALYRDDGSRLGNKIVNHGYQSTLEIAMVGRQWSFDPASDLLHRTS